MGSNESKSLGAAADLRAPERTADGQPVTPDPYAARAIGLENYGNTCYINSVMQLLFSCRALRVRLIEMFESTYQLKCPSADEETTLWRLSELFYSMHNATKKRLVIGPQQFVVKVKRDNALFANSLQHDAHEFAVFLLNGLIEAERKLMQLQATEKSPIQQIFEGRFASETFCLECETKTVRHEPFLDLSVDIEANASLFRCIETFSMAEFLVGADKFRCNACAAQTCARRSLRVDQLSTTLIVHLKRFKYVDDRHKKLSWHVAIPFELRFPSVERALSQSGGNVSAGPDGPAATPPPAPIFRLSGFVIHQGVGPNLGHYVTVVRHPNGWRRFDDDVVSEIHERDVQMLFGVPLATEGSTTSTAYILLYERIATL